MPFMPFQILGVWLRGLLALAIPILAIFCLKWWYDDSWVVDRAEVVRVEAAGPDRVATTVVKERIPKAAAEGGARRRVSVADPSATVRRAFRFDPGWNRPTAELAAGAALLAWAVAGRWIGWVLTSMLLRLRRATGGGTGASPGSLRSSERAEVSGPAWLSGRGPIEAEEPQPEVPHDLRTGRVYRIRRPDGSELRVETYGPDDAPPLVLTHGWGANADEWYYQKRYLAGRFRLIVWDLAGLGFSTQPDNHDYSMEKMAADLEAVLALAGDSPAVLVGHSIGGMILLTFSRLFPETLGRRVAGPGRGAQLLQGPDPDRADGTALRGAEGAGHHPALAPDDRGLAPGLFMNWLSYVNGSLQRSTRKQSFAGPGTPAQVDFLSRLMLKARPDVLARGMFGMMAFDESATLPAINVPTLVVIGDKDVTTVPEAGAFIARNIAGALPVTLSPARHLGLFEYHGQFDQVLADFASSCLATAPSTVVTT